MPPCEVPLGMRDLFLILTKPKQFGHIALQSTYERRISFNRNNRAHGTLCKALLWNMLVADQRYASVPGL
jgi:hypothetical protein